MSNQLSLLLIFALISSIISEYTSTMPYAYPIPPTRQTFRQQFSSNDFVLDLAKQPSAYSKLGGIFQFAFVWSFPALSGEGLSMGFLTLDPCSVVLPHVHPRASVVIYVTYGEFLRSGFTEENGGRTIINDLKTGQVRYFCCFFLF